MENFIDFDPLAWAGQPEQPETVKEVKTLSVEPTCKMGSAEFSAVTPSARSCYGWELTLPTPTATGTDWGSL